MPKTPRPNRTAVSVKPPENWRNEEAKQMAADASLELNCVDSGLWRWGRTDWGYVDGSDKNALLQFTFNLRGLAVRAIYRAERFVREGIGIDFEKLQEDEQRYIVAGIAKESFRRYLNRIGGKDVMSGHGFRAMARTIIDEVLHVRVDLIEHQLGHAVKDPNGRAYNRTSFLAERTTMMQSWSDYLDELRIVKDAASQRA